MQVIKQVIIGSGDTQTVKMVVRSNERGPQGLKGERGTQGPQGIPGPRGLDGAIQYKAGVGINITENNTIEATGAATATWGGLQGDIQDQTDLQNEFAQYMPKVDLAEVATSGSYNDLSDTPTIPAAQVNSDWSAVSGVAQILNKPSIPVITMTTTDPGEGATLAANNFIAVYSA